MSFNALEHHRTIAYSTLTPSIAGREAVREGAIQSNQLELYANNPELVSNKQCTSRKIDEVELFQTSVKKLYFCPSL